MTAFFVPGVDPERAEARYAELAELAAAEVAPPDDRVHSVRFVRGAEAWTATVGERLTGRLASRTARRGAPTREVDDPATVLAILRAGDAYRVVTDARPVGPLDDSTWENPFTVAHRDTRELTRFEG